MPRQHNAILPYTHSDSTDRDRDQRLSQGKNGGLRKIDLPERISARSIGEIGDIVPVHNPAHIHWIFGRTVHNQGACHAIPGLDNPDFACEI